MDLPDGFQVEPREQAASSLTTAVSFAYILFKSPHALVPDSGPRAGDTAQLNFSPKEKRCLCIWVRGRGVKRGGFLEEVARTDHRTDSCQWDQGKNNGVGDSEHWARQDSWKTRAASCGGWSPHGHKEQWWGAQPGVTVTTAISCLYSLFTSVECLALPGGRPWPPAGPAAR